MRKRSVPRSHGDPELSRSRLIERAKGVGGSRMRRSVLIAVTAAVMMSPNAAMADNKSDCQKGVAMIKAELNKKHPEPVLVTLRKALSDAETEVIRMLRRTEYRPPGIVVEHCKLRPPKNNHREPRVE